MIQRQCFDEYFREIPGVIFFTLNAAGEILFASRGILMRYGFAEESEIIGKTDFDLDPSDFAQQYVRDDKPVYSTELPIKECLEPWV